MNKFFILTTFLFISSCATVKIPASMAGSKADGTITMGYSYGSFERPQVEWDKSLETAKKRCVAWGYENAEPFERAQQKCTDYNGYGCVAWDVSIQYQCLNKTSKK